MTDQLQKKIAQAIKLLQMMAPQDGSPVEVAYSGGKDSDVILQLAKEAGINYRAIYKNTTIDPPGTIRHAQDMGVEILSPKRTFLQLVAKMGYPNRMQRFCCRFLKEYKVLDKAIVGIRREESRKRSERYKEPTACRVYGKDEHVEQIFPILEWTNEDVAAFIADRGIQCAPIYYDEKCCFHVERRLGCMCCPMASYKKRLEQFKMYPGMVKAYIRAGQKFRDTHPDSKNVKMYADVYEWFYRDVFCESQEQYRMGVDNIFGKPDFKQLI